MNKNKVAVIIILYNRMPNEKLICCIEQLKKQTLQPQIIVCEQNDFNDESFEQYCLNNSVVHIKAKTDEKWQGNMGYLKNLGIISAEADYLYFLDSDILLMVDNYLEQIVNFAIENDEIIFVHPKMLRLKGNQEGMIKDILNNKSINIFLNHINNCFCDYNSDTGFLNFNYKEKYRFFNNLTHVSISSEEDKWLLNFHSGGIFVKKSLIENLGGYSQVYYHWGMDDIDTQWKLNETYGARNIYEVFPDLYVIHFEHETLNEGIDHLKNRKIFNQRREEGLTEAINYDIQCFKKLREEVNKNVR